MQIAPRSRVKVQEYIEVEELVTAAVGRVNGSFGQADWTPIRYINQSYSRSALAALYRCARAGLVTPLRDGMNLVAKEYIASQNPDDPGVLILSRFAGAAKECTGAILINPYDTDSTAQAIAQALSMPLEERSARYRESMENLRRNDIADWGRKFLKRLTAADSELSTFAQISSSAQRQGA